MKFRLYYRGPLKANGSKQDKHEIRRKFHDQLKNLWSQKPLNPEFTRYIKEKVEPHELGIIKRIGKFRFVPLVCEALRTIADLDIIFLRPEEPGCIVTKGGDIDNRIKTLLDALRMPKDMNEIYQDPDSPDPFFCLLEDDALVTHLSVTTDRLLDFTNEGEVILLITVTVRVSQTIWANLSLVGN